MSIEAVSLFGIKIHRATMPQVVAELLAWMTEEAACRYVVTPNIDHIVQLRSSVEMQHAYHAASLIVADGWPLVTASRWLGRPLPERVAGSDLVPALLAAGSALPEFRVFLLGAGPGVAAIACDYIQQNWPSVDVAGFVSPPRGFETDHVQSAEIADTINRAAPHLLVIGLGAPRQEIWLDQYAPRLNARVAIAGGATIDFLAGVQTRAPRLMQQLRLEWLFRLLSDPKRLAGRYARDAFLFPLIFLREWVQVRRTSRF